MLEGIITIIGLIIMGTAGIIVPTVMENRMVNKYFERKENNNANN